MNISCKLYFLSYCLEIIHWPVDCVPYVAYLSLDSLDSFAQFLAVGLVQLRLVHLHLERLHLVR